MNENQMDTKNKGMHSQLKTANKDNKIKAMSDRDRQRNWTSNSRNRTVNPLATRRCLFNKFYWSKDSYLWLYPEK